MAIEKQHFREAIGRFTSGVSVMTTRYDGRNYGMTASAMASLSLEPTMLLICINKAVPTHDAIRYSDRFAVNVLSHEQEELAKQFARPAEDKFVGVPVSEGKLGLPIIRGTVANFECNVTDRVTGGTHTIFLGEVEAAEASDRDPLVYFSGSFGHFLARDEAREPTLASALGVGVPLIDLSLEHGSDAWHPSLDVLSHSLREMGRRAGA